MNLLDYFPKALGCVDGHIGKPVKTWFEELDDDRYHLMVVERCGNCDIPLSEDYATPKQRERFYKGESPE